MAQALPLPHARYIVLQHEGAWKINLDNRYFGPFTTRDAAVTMATDTARKASEGGYPASVLLMIDGHFDILWTSTSSDNAAPQ